MLRKLAVLVAVLVVVVLALFLATEQVKGNDHYDEHCFLKSTWTMENPNAPGHWVMERYWYCDYPYEEYAELYPDNHTHEIRQCNEPGFTWCRDIYLWWYWPHNYFFPVIKN